MLNPQQEICHETTVHSLHGKVVDLTELAPPLKEDDECWYLPAFGVYHPQNPDQIRLVFNSSVQDDGISLNNVLLTGLNLNNSLLRVFIHFQKEQEAIMADI